MKFALKFKCKCIIDWSVWHLKASKDPMNSSIQTAPQLLVRRALTKKRALIAATRTLLDLRQFFDYNQLIHYKLSDSRFQFSDNIPPNALRVAHLLCILSRNDVS